MVDGDCKILGGVAGLQVVGGMVQGDCKIYRGEGGRVDGGCKVAGGRKKGGGGL